MKITLIVGLPGSGKTYYANTLAAPGVIIIDDFRRGDLGNLPNENSFENLIIIDPNFCDSVILDFAQRVLKNHYHIDIDIDIVYFENNAQKALRNIEFRDDGRKVSNFIHDYTKIYNPPSDAKKIWQPEDWY